MTDRKSENARAAERKAQETERIRQELYDTARQIYQRGIDGRIAEGIPYEQVIPQGADPEQTAPILSLNLDGTLLTIAPDGAVCFVTGTTEDSIFRIPEDNNGLVLVRDILARHTLPDPGEELERTA